MNTPILPRLIQGKIPLPRIPVWFMRQAGRYLPEYRALRQQHPDFWDRCFTPGLAAEITLQPLRRFDLDAAIIFSDILTIPWALGQHVVFMAGEGPKLSALNHGNDLRMVNPAGVTERLQPVYQAISQVRMQLAPEKSLIGFAGAPWTVATYMVEGGGSRDFRRCFNWAYRERETFLSLLHLLADVTAEHLIAQIRAGADTVQVFDTWAGAVPARLFGDFVIGPTRRIVARVKAACPTVPVIGFPKGAGMRLLAYREETGVDAVGLDVGIPLDWAREHISGHTVTQGNLDPLLLVAGGDDLDRAVGEILQTFAGTRHIFNLGHGIVPETPIENVARVIERIRRFSGQAVS